MTGRCARRGSPVIGRGRPTGPLADANISKCPVVIGSPKQRILLAALAVEDNRNVGTGALIDLLGTTTHRRAWG